MTAVPRELARKQPADIRLASNTIEGQTVPNVHVKTPNPHTAAMRISAIGLIAVAVGTVHGLHGNPGQLPLVAGADVAAIGMFLLNALRWMRSEEQR